MNTDKVPVTLYDMSIQDLSERQKAKQTFASTTAAARMFGLNVNQFIDRIGNAQAKKYLHCKKTGKTFAVRRGG